MSICLRLLSTNQSINQIYGIININCWCCIVSAAAAAARWWPVDEPVQRQTKCERAMSVSTRSVNNYQHWMSTIDTGNQNSNTKIKQYVRKRRLTHTMNCVVWFCIKVYYSSCNLRDCSADKCTRYWLITQQPTTSRMVATTHFQLEFHFIALTRSLLAFVY